MYKKSHVSAPLTLPSWISLKIVFYMMQRPKYNNMEPDPVEFFGECMNSPQNGRTQLADDIYVSYQ